MEDILHEYTAGELLKWLTDREIDEYIDIKIMEDSYENSATYNVLDVEKVKIDFIRDIRRYEVVKRGKTLYIHDNKTCQDILSWNFTDDDYEYIQNTATLTCESLNNRTMRFIGKKERCWW